MCQLNDSFSIWQKDRPTQALHHGIENDKTVSFDVIGSAANNGSRTQKAAFNNFHPKALFRSIEHILRGRREGKHGLEQIQ
jgi:hypothetical protein